MPFHESAMIQIPTVCSDNLQATQTLRCGEVTESNIGPAVEMLLTTHPELKRRTFPESCFHRLTLFELEFALHSSFCGWSRGP